MKRVSILALNGSPSISIIGPMDIFCKASEFWRDLYGGESTENYFETEIVSGSTKNIRGLNDYPIYCHKTIKDISETDLILVPSLKGDIEQAINENKKVIQWLREQYEKGAEIGSFCTGTFLLAEAGLLNNKSATTHWKVADTIREQFPDIDLKPDKIITDEGNIFCSGGATSFLNLTIYLIEKYCGHDVAVQTCKNMLIDMDKVSQSNYVIFSTQKYHDDKPILDAQEYIEANYGDNITLNDLADKFHLSKRSLIRRFKNATGNTPYEYIQRVRIEAVKKALETGSGNIQQLVYEVGYSDESTFRKLFKKYTGMPPGAYKNKFKRFVTSYA